MGSHWTFLSRQLIWFALTFRKAHSGGWDLKRQAKGRSRGTNEEALGKIQTTCVGVPSMQVLSGQILDLLCRWSGTINSPFEVKVLFRRKHFSLYPGTVAVKWYSKGPCRFWDASQGFATRNWDTWHLMSPASFSKGSCVDLLHYVGWGLSS